MVDRGAMTPNISIHAPTGGATSLLPDSEPGLPISIHAPTGGATTTMEDVISLLTISIHAPTGGATMVVDLFSASQAFQSTLPRGERHVKGKYIDVDDLFQSTLPRGERREPRSPAHHQYRISIHAPTGGATGAVRLSRWCSGQRYFNPRSHGGSDTPVLSGGVPGKDISIHAPTGGATAKVTKFK